MFNKENINNFNIKTMFHILNSNVILPNISRFHDILIGLSLKSIFLQRGFISFIV